MTMETVSSTRGGRPIIFTPERMAQIRNLVERGHSREQIAEIVGCTLGSLQVTCSRLGISLRRLRPPPTNGNGLLPLRVVASDPPKTNGPPPSPPGDPAQEPPPKQTVTVMLRIEHRGRTREVKIPFSSKALMHLVLEAEMRGISLAELIIDILTTHADNKD